MKIVSNCPLCEEQSLHVIEEDGIGTQQCINCGYATTSKFIGTREDNETYKTLPEEEQKNYPVENGEGFYKQIYDTENAKIYDIFLDAMVEMNKKAKADGPTEISTQE